MAESIAEANFYNPLPTREERMRVFIGDIMSQDDRDMAHSLAMSFEDAQRPMQKTAVILPVAAHQDGGYIFRTLGEYAKQQNCDPFTVFLHLNAPNNGDDMADGIKTSLNALGTARRAYPNLDVRSTLTEYDSPTIGEIRRDAWNAVLMLAYHEGLFAEGKDDVIGINHDVDTHFISPHYISRVQQYYKQRQYNANRVSTPDAVHKPVGTRVSHAVLDSHPNIGKVTQWVDNSLFQAPNHTSYEAGVVVPFSFYATWGGFNPSAQTHETSWIHGDRKNPLNHITGAQLYTSPRRYIDRVAEHGTNGIWSPESFGPNDQCREALRPDITVAQAEDLILDRMQSDMRETWLLSVIEPVAEQITHASLLKLTDPNYEAELKAQARIGVAKQLHKAERLLRRVIKSDILADILRDGFDGDEHADSIVSSLVLFNRVSETIIEENQEGKEILLKLK